MPTCVLTAYLRGMLKLDIFLNKLTDKYNIKNCLGMEFFYFISHARYLSKVDQLIYRLVLTILNYFVSYFFHLKYKNLNDFSCLDPNLCSNILWHYN